MPKGNQTPPPLVRCPLCGGTARQERRNQIDARMGWRNYSCEEGHFFHVHQQTYAYWPQGEQAMADNALLGKTLLALRRDRMLSDADLMRVLRVAEEGEAQFWRLMAAEFLADAEVR